jgi:hypothetical protein
MKDQYQKPQAEVIKFDENSQFMTASSNENGGDNGGENGVTGNCQVIINNTNGTSYCAIVTGVSGGAYAGEVCYRLS